MNIRPLYDRIVVKRLEATDEKTASGLIIPDSAKEKPQEGEVVAVGQGKRNDDGKLIPLDVFTELPPLAARYCMRRPLLPVTSTRQLAAPGAVLARSIRPPFANGCVFCTLTTPVERIPSPAKG